LRYVRVHSGLDVCIVVWTCVLCKSNVWNGHQPIHIC